MDESIDNHPKVIAARKAHAKGEWDGNVNKEGEAVVHINGKPHVVTNKSKTKNLRREDVTEADIAEILRQYALSENVNADQLAELTEEEINEIIGKAVGGAFKLGAKAVVGAARMAKKAVVNKQGNIRGTRAARQDAAGNRAEKEARKKEAEYKRKKRIQDMKKRASDLDKKISSLSSDKPATT